MNTVAAKTAHTQVSVDETGNHYLIHSLLTGELLQKIQFHSGPMDAGPQGVFLEDLMNVCITRLIGFQKGPYACIENQRAIASLENAIAQLNLRTNRVTQNPDLDVK